MDIYNTIGLSSAALRSHAGHSRKFLLIREIFVFSILNYKTKKVGLQRFLANKCQNTKDFPFKFIRRHLTGGKD